jgi:uncharacterized membrane protein
MKSEYYRLVISGIGLVGIFFVFLAVRYFWKSRLGNKSDKPSNETFTLYELRKMYRNGLINQEEFDKLREKIIRETSGKSK